jgi:hypothetical protein
MFYLALLASQASSLDRDLGCGNVSGRGLQQIEQDLLRITDLIGKR